MSWITGIARFPGRRAAALPAADGRDDGRDDEIYVASQWQLMWWKFRRHKMALAAGWIVIGLYLVAIFVEFLAPYDPEAQDVRFAYQPPSTIRFFDAEGNFYPRPFVYGMTRKRSLETLSLVFAEDTNVVHPIGILVPGPPYKLWGIIPANLHLFGVASEDARVFVLGADAQGRDVLSRLIYGTRIPMSVGLIGVALSFILGIAIGGVSGYYGGRVDTFIQRVIEFIRSMPSIPLWMALAAALPANWPPLQVYFAITIILSLIGWTGLARVVRGRFLALREEENIRSIAIAPWLLAPTGAVVLAVLALNFLGDGLRDAADPYAR